MNVYHGKYICVAKEEEWIFPPVIKRFRSTDVVFAAAEVSAGNEFNHFISNVVRFDEETFPIALSLPITRKLG